MNAVLRPHLRRGDAPGRAAWVRRAHVAALALSLGLALLVPVRAQAAAKDEYDVRAALLYNITRFVSWPDSTFEDAGSAVVIGVLTPDPFGDKLERMLHGRRTAGDRPLRAVEVRSVDEARACHVLFVCEQAESRHAALLTALDTAPTLLVGETLDFVRGGGGAFSLWHDEGKVARIELHLNASEVEEAGLEVRSQLRRLCEAVEGFPAR